MKIKYAKSVCLTILYVLIVSLVYIGLSKLCGQEVSLNGLSITIASCGIFLHYMDKENQEED